MTDTIDLQPGVSGTVAGSEPAPKTRRRATSGGGGLSSLLLTELQSLAGDLGIEGTAKLRKSQLIEAIQAHQAGAPAPVNDTAAPAKAEPKAEPVQAESVEVEQPTESDSRSDSRSDEESEDSADEGERGGRVDRGRERFLEREAKRQERIAVLVAEGMTAEAASELIAQERLQREAQRQQAREGRPREARQPEARQAEPRQERQEQARQAEPRQERQEIAGPRQDQGDEDDFDARRGRFRERGRGRNRTRERYPAGNEAEPMIGEDDVLIPIGGILDILDNYAFVRTAGYLTGPNDVYVSLQQVRKYGLRRGDAVTGAVRQQREGETKAKYNALVRLDSINGMTVEEARNRADFSKLTPLYPQDRLRLETEANLLTTRVIDLVMPIGKGQRALIVSPPKAGKTMVMQAIANAITTNNPECHLMVVLVDERPEEVTDMQRSVKGEVIASTFDRPPQDHITVAELSIERAKRLVELGHDVVLLLDSVTSLARAYNVSAPATGRTLAGGVDAGAVHPPKQLFGAARNVEGGGSLTVLATIVVETGSATDEVIFEEFGGTANMELRLRRELAEAQTFPAVDIVASGTRQEALLSSEQEAGIVRSLRRKMSSDAIGSVEGVLDQLRKAQNNIEFLTKQQKPGAGRGN